MALCVINLSFSPRQRKWVIQRQPDLSLEDWIWVFEKIQRQCTNTSTDTNLEAHSLFFIPAEMLLRKLNCSNAERHLRMATQYPTYYVSHLLVCKTERSAHSTCFPFLKSLYQVPGFSPFQPANFTWWKTKQSSANSSLKCQLECFYKTKTDWTNRLELLVRVQASLSLCCEVAEHLEWISMATLVWIYPVITWKEMERVSETQGLRNMS